MATRIAKSTTYHIDSSSITFVENSGYGVQLIQVSASSSCYIKVYDKDNGIFLDSELNVRRWKVTAYNNKFPDGDTEAWFIYVRLERNGTSALVIYDKRDRAVNGGIITTTTDENGDETKEVGEPDPVYFYIKIGTVGATDGVSIIREITYDTGLLGADGETYAMTDILASMFIPHYDDPTDPNKLTWIEAKSHMGIQGGVTMFVEGDGINLPSIYEGLPVDGESIYWEEIKDEEGNVIDKVLKAKADDFKGTLGSLTNVGEWADAAATADRIMVQKKDSTTWTSLSLEELGTASFENVKESGEGNAYTSIELSEDKKTLTLNKGESFAKQTDYEALNTKVTDFLEGSDTDNIINKWKELEKFLGDMTESDELATILSGKADKATTLSGYGITNAYTKTEVTDLLKDYLPLAGGTVTGNLRLRTGTEYTSPYLYFGDGSEVYLREATDQYLTVHADRGIVLDAPLTTIDGIDIKKSADGVLFIDANLVVSGGITMYGTDGTISPSIWDGAPIASTREKGIASFDSEFFAVNNGEVTFIGQTGGGVTSWEELEGKPSWIGSVKPEYTFSEIISKPTTIEGYGIIDVKIVDGVITLGSSTITPLTQEKGDARYLRLTGGTLSNGSAESPLVLDSSSRIPYITFKNNGVNAGFVGGQASGNGMMMQAGTASGEAYSVFKVNVDGSMEVSTNDVYYDVLTTKNYGSYLGYIGSTKVQKSAATQDLTGIGSINSAITINSGDDSAWIKGTGHKMYFGGTGYANQSYYFRPLYSASGATTSNLYIQNASAAASPTFTTTHSFLSNGNASHAGSLTINGIELSKSKDDVLFIDANLVVRGAITMYGTDSVTASTIMDAISVDGTTIMNDGKKLYLNPNLELGGLDEDALADYLTSNGAPKLSVTRTVWGQPFNGTSNVEGDLNSKGNIYVTSSTATTVNLDSGKIKFNSMNPVSGTKDFLRSPYIQAKGGQTYGRKRLSIFQSNEAQYDTEDGFTEAFTVLPNGNVGIGNVSPSNKLHVEGKVNVTDVFYGGSSIYCGGKTSSTDGVAGVCLGASGIYITSSSSPYIRFYSENSTAVTQQITASADYLSFSGATYHQGHLYLSGAKASSSSGNTTQLVLGTPNTQYVAISSNTGAVIINPSTTATTGQIVLGVNDKNTSFRSSGNFGIGVDSPTYKLHVAGTMYASGATTLGGNLSVSGTSTYAGKTTHNGGLGATTGTFSSTLSGNEVVITNSGGTTSGHLRFSRANANYIAIPTGGTLAVNLDGSMNVAGSDLIVRDGAVHPGTSGSTSLGRDGNLWNGLYLYGGSTSHAFNKFGINFGADVARISANPSGNLGIYAIGDSSKIYLRAGCTTSGASSTGLIVDGDGNVQITGNLLVQGGITMYADTDSSSSSIWDGAPLATTGSTTGSTKGVASFDSKFFKVTDGHVTFIGSTGGSGGSTSMATLSWSGYSSGSYDGTAAKSITIPNNTNQLTNGAGYVTSSGSVASATKATQDGSGNVITSTYLKLSGGTMTGTLTSRAIAPSASDTYDLGSTSKLWASVCASMGYFSDSVGVGTSSPSYTLHVNGDIGCGTYAIYNSTTNPRLVLRRTASSQTWIVQAISSGMALGSTSANSCKIDANGNFSSPGTVTQGSDIRYKTVHSDIQLSLALMSAAPSFEFHFNSDTEMQAHVGTSAQYWQSVNGVVRADEGGRLHMDYSSLGVVMGISLAKELSRFESDTDRRIRLLEEENKKLKEEIEQLKTA